MKKSVDEFDRYIIERNRQYLAYVKPGTRMISLMFTQYKYDAAPVEKKSDAVQIARKVGGAVVKFNSITGDVQR